jgi:MtN3 and saliva related transmembrane protein
MLDTIKHNIDVIGITASVIGLLRFIPMVFEIYKTKKTNNFPYLMLGFAIISTILWLIYGFINYSISLLIFASIALSVYLFILFMKLKY